MARQQLRAESDGNENIENIENIERRVLVRFLPLNKKEIFKINWRLINRNYRGGTSNELTKKVKMSGFERERTSTAGE